MRWFESSHPSNALRKYSLVCSDSGSSVSTEPAYLDAMVQAFVEGDLVRAGACFADDAVYREIRRTPVHGRAAIAEHFAAFTASGVAWQFVLDDLIVAADRACVVYRFIMAEGQDRPGRERAGCALVHLDARGQIAEWREYEG
jgi:ketosteroid isomerase-like protein